MAFHFKQFSIEDDRSSMKVSTDSILLGSWAKADEVCALDIGTGCGLLTLMLAQRFPKLLITAIELDPSSCEQAHHNMENSPWQDRLELVNGDVRSWKPLQQFNTVICNPPYFQDGLTSNHQKRAHARHGKKLSFRELWDVINVMVTNSGSANLVLPYAEYDRLSRAAEQVGWSTSRQLTVHKNSDAPPTLVLSEWRRSQSKLLNDPAELFLHDKKGQYTEEFRLLTKSFYL